MEKVKVKNVKTGVVKEIDKSIAGDYLGMKDWKLATAEREEKYVVKEDKILEK